MATVRITPSAAPPPIGVRLSSHSASGISATIPTNASNDPRVEPMRSQPPLLRRRMRSLGVTMSVRRMPNLSLTTTTSPCAMR